MPRPIKHGLSPRKNPHPLYSRWEGMIQRTSNPNCPTFKYYGGRGISVCDEWRAFVTFYEWSINNGFSTELELDRINSDGNYCPENCRWIDGKTNRQNVAKRKRNKSENWGITQLKKSFMVQVWCNGAIKRAKGLKSIEEARIIRDQLALV